MSSSQNNFIINHNFGCAMNLILWNCARQDFLSSQVIQDQVFCDILRLVKKNQKHLITYLDRLCRFQMACRKSYFAFCCIQRHGKDTDENGLLKILELVGYLNQRQQRSKGELMKKKYWATSNQSKGKEQGRRLLEKYGIEVMEGTLVRKLLMIH